MTTILQAEQTPRGFVEKTALERYVPPAKPSLIGMSRAALADALGEIGVPAKQRKMRVQQLWNWIYVRGVTRFAEMTSVSKELRAALEERFTLERPEVESVMRRLEMPMPSPSCTISSASRTASKL